MAVDRSRSLLVELQNHQEHPYGILSDVILVSKQEHLVGLHHSKGPQY